MKKTTVKAHARPDWDALKQRLAQSVGDGPAAPLAEQQILQSRADLLAREQQQTDTASSQVEVLEFILAHEHYAVETAWVKEVCPLKSLTPLPSVPTFVVGIVNLRGHLVSVIDLKKFFNLPDRGLTDLNKIIVLKNEAMEFGVLADAVVGVSKLSAAALNTAQAALTDARLEYLQGVTAERLVLLDAQQLLNDTRMIINEEVTS